MKKEKGSITLSTAICIFIIILLVAALFGMYYYFALRNNSTDVSKKPTAGNALATNLSKENVLVANSTLQSNEIVENKEETTDKDATIKTKTVTLNGTTHTLRAETTLSDEDYETSEDYLLKVKTKVYLDDKLIKTFDIFNSTTFMGDIETAILKNSDKSTEYLLFTVTNYSPYSTGKYFTFANEEGEILGVILWSDATTIKLNETGEDLTYKIEEDKFIFYDPSFLGESAAAIELTTYVTDNAIYMYPTKAYNSSEITMTGAKR